jgi:hypothetical protein
VRLRWPSRHRRDFGPPRIDVEARLVADLDRRLGQIDGAIQEAAQTNAALSTIEGQRKARAGLVDERKREAGALTALQVERATVTAKGRQIETELGTRFNGAAGFRYLP